MIYGYLKKITTNSSLLAIMHCAILTAGVAENNMEEEEKDKG